MRDHDRTLDEPTLQPLLAHLYGPSLGRTLAQLARATEGERVVVLNADPTGPGGWLPDPDELFAQDPATTLVQDPLPLIEFLSWQGREAAESSFQRRWDVVVGFPPQGLSRDEQQLELLELLHRTAPPGARVVLLLLPGVLEARHSRAERFRAALLELGQIEQLVFTSRAPVRNRAYPLSIAPVVVGWLPGQGPGETHVSRDQPGQDAYRVRLQPGEPWTHHHLDPERAQRLARWATQGQARPLAELVDFPRPTLQTLDDRRQLHPRSLTPGGIDLDIAAPESRRPHHERYIELQAGDIVGRSMHDPCWTLITVDDVDEGLAADPSHVIVLRPTEVDAKYLLTFLQSDAATEQLGLATRGSIIPRLSRSELRDVLIPTLDLPPDAVEQYESVRELRSLAEALARQLEERYRAAFDEPNADKVSAALADAGRDAKMAATLLSRVTDPIQQARAFLPHPLARTLRVLENHRQADSAIDIYQDQLRFGETAVILLGALGLAYLDEVGEPIDDEWHRNFTRAGVSLGTWHHAANRAAAVARGNGDQLGGIARALSTNSPLNKILDQFVAKRNDDAHGAGPRSPYEYAQAILELDELLQGAIERLAPLARTDWFVIEQLHWNAREKAFRLVGRSLRGDHPDFEPWSETHPGPLEIGPVHVKLDGFLLPLGGFCILRPCSRCLHEELYYPDQLRGSFVRLRSLDRGHQTELSFNDIGLPVQVASPPATQREDA